MENSLRTVIRSPGFVETYFVNVNDTRFTPHLKTGKKSNQLFAQADSEAPPTDLRVIWAVKWEYYLGEFFDKHD